MSRVPLFAHQDAILFLSLLCTAAVAYPAWNKHDVHEVSPAFTIRDQVGRWVTRRERAQHCLAMSVQVDISTMAPALNGEDRGPWFAVLRCNEPRIAWRLAAVTLAPWATFTLLFFAVRVWRINH